MYDLKPISPDAESAALDRAERYRLLNEPMEAESICLDVLRVDPENQRALITYLLALTDQFETRLGPAVSEALSVVARLRDDYARSYYQGVICERRAKTHLERGGPDDRYAAYEGFLRAMEHFENAEAIRPPHNDEAILRWNTCVRMLERHPHLEPRPADALEHMLE